MKPLRVPTLADIAEAMTDPAQAVVCINPRDKALAEQFEPDAAFLAAADAAWTARPFPENDPRHRRAEQRAQDAADWANRVGR